MANKLSQYFVDSWKELSKVTWPTRNRAINICILVLAFVGISTVAIAAVDYVFHQGYLSLFTLQTYLINR